MACKKNIRFHHILNLTQAKFIVKISTFLLSFFSPFSIYLSISAYFFINSLLSFSFFYLYINIPIFFNMFSPFFFFIPVSIFLLLSFILSSFIYIYIYIYISWLTIVKCDMKAHFISILTCFFIVFFFSSFTTYTHTHSPPSLSIYIYLYIYRYLSSFSRLSYSLF